MIIQPVGAESLGTRSFCFFIVTADVKVLIDPSVSLAPVRFGLKPHLLELAASYATRQVIKQLALVADVVIQTHYHADHLTLGIKRFYEFTDQEVAREIYQHKMILAKDLNSVSYNQRKRGYWLWKRDDLKIIPADGTSFTRGKTRIKFSAPVPHGIQGSRTGKVIQLMVMDGNSGKSCLITSDVNGPGSEEALEFILDNQPEICFLDGPSTYHPKVTAVELDSAAERLKRLVDTVPRLVVDHHFLRDLNWRKWWENNTGTKACCVADYLGIIVENLEAKRKELHKDHPCSPDLYEGLEKNSPGIRTLLETTVEQLSSWTYWERLSKSAGNR
ncbi:MAG: MBL fold metallo-hydrolase [Candidatus Odinarchaeota archaeon]